MSQDRSLKRALDSVESLDELADGSLASSQKYFEVDSSKVYLKITDIVKDLTKFYGARWFFRHLNYLRWVKTCLKLNNFSKFKCTDFIMEIY